MLSVEDRKDLDYRTRNQRRDAFRTDQHARRFLLYLRACTSVTGDLQDLYRDLGIKECETANARLFQRACERAAAGVTGKISAGKLASQKIAVLALFSAVCLFYSYRTVSAPLPLCPAGHSHPSVELGLRLPAHTERIAGWVTRHWETTPLLLQSCVPPWIRDKSRWGRTASRRRGWGSTASSMGASLGRRTSGRERRRRGRGRRGEL
jgi:hypothetical protein